MKAHERIDRDTGGRIQFSRRIKQRNKDGCTSAYSDRMWEWNPEKFDASAEAVWGNSGQSFYANTRHPVDVERFLRLYHDNPRLILYGITRFICAATGYDVWRFEHYNPDEGDHEHVQ